MNSSYSSPYGRIAVREESNSVSVGLEPSEHFTGIRYEWLKDNDNYLISIFFCAEGVKIERTREYKSTLAKAKDACLEKARNYAKQLAEREKLAVEDLTLKPTLESTLTY